MARQITPKTTLEQLKREAKRWLRALRDDVGEAAARARARLERAFPHAPGTPTLRHVQHALARELGFDGWRALKDRLLGAKPYEDDDDDLDQRHVALFLDHACPDHHVRGGPAHSRAQHSAMRMLERYPQLAHETFYTAIVCGERNDVARALAADPTAANRRNDAPALARSAPGHIGDELRDLGAKPWEPILFLAFTRLPIDAVTDNAVAIATDLLDHGADPNVYFMAGGSRYTPLVGVIGEGEEERAPHPKRDELVQLLLERGAEPYDIQVLYNMHFKGDILWYLKLAYERSLTLGRAADWTDPDWQMLGMGGYGPGAHYLLGVAVAENDFEAAEWMLSRGANPNLPTNYSHPKFRPNRSLYERAVRSGRDEMAELLRRYGASAVSIELSDVERFAAACTRLDRAEAERLVEAHPDLLRAAAPAFEAANHDRVDVMRLLLDLGMSPNVEDDTKQRPLHMAGYSNSVNVARVLIDCGAEIDPVEKNWQNTPLGAAVYSQSKDMIALLSPLSTDFWELVFVGAVDRLRELLAAKPERARMAGENYTTLMWLPPDDERRALEVATLLVSHGADPAITDESGLTAADRAERLGMYEVARYLRGAASRSNVGEPQPLRLADYEIRAQTLLEAYRTGTPDAMEHLYEYTWHRRPWSGFRTYVQLDLGRASDDPDLDRDITVDDAHFLIAREYGFDSWRALEDFVAALPAKTGAMATKPVALLTLDQKGDTHASDRTRDWDTALSRIAAGGFDGLDAEGEMTDALLEHLSRLEHITLLKIGGSKAVTDAGLRHLSRMPQLRYLEVDGCSITDAGLDVLRELPALQGFSATWTRISDAGTAHLAASQGLVAVNLLGTACGDGTIAALRGQSALRHFTSGNGVTDDGLPMLHDFPVFKAWKGGEVSMALLSYHGDPNQLTLRGQITDRGVAKLAGLDGLFGLNIDDSHLQISGAGITPLTTLPNLGWFAFDAKDDSMPYIAAMPNLRFLGCQDASASDNGWASLGLSKSIEYIWGRRCYGLSDRGFRALATMPALRGLSVSCKNVSDDALGAFPSFPSLRELMPMDVPDEGYRYIGKCVDLDRLILMYCRGTTDRSTELIAGLPKLRRYFASYNKITDRSMEILSGMLSLEEVELSAVSGVTNAGVAKLARLPRLREVRVSGNRLTRDVVSLFPPTVHVHYDF